MNTKQKTNWWIDAGLFYGLVFCFYLDLTGIEVHQWLGVMGGALAVYHLILHWSWVAAVSQRFFSRTSGKARLYYLIDWLLFSGLLLVTLSGLVISTWLDLPLDSYADWLWVHIASSIVALSLTVLKLVLHWRWIVSATRSVLSPQPVLRQLPAPVRQAAGARQMSRAEFLKVLGLVGVTSFLALTSASTNLKTLQSIEAAASPDETAEDPAAADQSTTSLGATTEPESVPSSSAVAEPAATAASPTELPVVDANSAASTEASSSTTCQVRCDHRCAYPGHCRKYTDSNQNGYCDLGECL